MSKDDIMLRMRRACRQACGARSNVPVVVVNGRRKPRVLGEGFYYTTPGGKAISHPNAYHWPKVYHASTIRVEVGRQWVMRRFGEEILLSVMAGGAV